MAQQGRHRGQDDQDEHGGEHQETDLWRRVPLQQSVAYEINDAPAVLDCVGHGLAAGMITASAVEGRRGIVLVPVRHHVPYFETAVAVAGGRRLGAAADALPATICRAAGVGDPGACLRR